MWPRVFRGNFHSPNGMGGTGSHVEEDPSSFAGDAGSKLNICWEKTIEQSGTKAEWPSLVKVSTILAQDVHVSINRKGDEMPPLRPKLIHTVGALAKIRIDWDKTKIEELKYTGLFCGAEYGVIRMSTALYPSHGYINPQPYMIAGIALKFFRSNRPSGNVFGMWKLIDQNTFKYSILFLKLCTD